MISTHRRRTSDCTRFASLAEWLKEVMLHAVLLAASFLTRSSRWDEPVTSAEGHSTLCAASVDSGRELENFKWIAPRKCSGGMVSTRAAAPLPPAEERWRSAPPTPCPGPGAGTGRAAAPSEARVYQRRFPGPRRRYRGECWRSSVPPRAASGGPGVGWGPRRRSDPGVAGSRAAG